MSERKKVPGAVVRVVLLRQQPELNGRQRNEPQVLAAMRPENGNIVSAQDVFQLIGGRYYDDESLLDAATRKVEEETGLVGLDLQQLAHVYENDGWQSTVFWAVVPAGQSDRMLADMNSNKGYVWFETDEDGQVIAERRDDQGELIYYFKFLADHYPMIADVLAAYYAQQVRERDQERDQDQEGIIK